MESYKKYQGKNVIKNRFPLLTSVIRVARPPARPNALPPALRFAHFERIEEATDSIIAEEGITFDLAA